MATGVNNANTRIYATSFPAVTLTDEAMTDAGDHQNYSITNQVKRMLDPNTAVVVQQANDEVQSVTLTGAPTGGTFTLTFGGNTTAAIAYNALPSAVQTALQALASIGAGNALVTGATGAWIVRFTATLGQASQALLTATPSLTGGSSPNVTIARVQAGSAFATISSGFVLYLVGARVVYTAAQSIGTVVKLHSGKYLPYMAIAGANTAEFAGQVAMIDTTDFTDAGWMSNTPTITSGTLKCHTFWHNSALIKNLLNRDLLAISYFDGDSHYEGYCWVGNSDLKSATKGVAEADYTFPFTDQFLID